jgi:hypothetical protein
MRIDRSSIKCTIEYSCAFGSQLFNEARAIMTRECSAPFNNSPLEISRSRINFEIQFDRLASRCYPVFSSRTFKRLFHPHVIYGAF